MHVHYLYILMKVNINVAKYARAAQMVGLMGPGPHHFLKLFFKNSMLLENNGDCGFQLAIYHGNCHEYTMAY